MLTATMMAPHCTKLIGYQSQKKKVTYHSS